VLRYGRFFMILDSQHISIGAPGNQNKLAREEPRWLGYLLHPHNSAHNARLHLYRLLFLVFSFCVF
jgi:hypothetical protein